MSLLLLLRSSASTPPATSEPLTWGTTPALKSQYIVVDDQPDLLTARGTISQNSSGAVKGTKEFATGKHLLAARIDVLEAGNPPAFGFANADVGIPYANSNGASGAGRFGVNGFYVVIDGTNSDGPFPRDAWDIGKWCLLAVDFDASTVKVKIDETWWGADQVDPVAIPFASSGPFRPYLDMQNVNTIRADFKGTEYPYPTLDGYAWMDAPAAASAKSRAWAFFMGF